MFLVLVLLFSQFLGEIVFARSHTGVAKIFHKNTTNILPNFEKCEHQICSDADVPNYPEKEIRNILSDQELLKILFGTILNVTPDIIMENRFAALDETSQFCSTIGPKIFSPRALRNVDLTWKYIVNVDNYNQNFSSVICQEVTEQGAQKIITNETWIGHCSKFGYVCKQFYQDVSLLTYMNGTLEFDRFSIPTTCSCVCGS